MTQGAGEILDDAVGIGIIRMRTDFELAVSPARRKHAPMGGMWQERAISRGGWAGLACCIDHGGTPAILIIFYPNKKCEHILGPCPAQRTLQNAWWSLHWPADA